jgi:two-component system response regulator HydG
LAHGISFAFRESNNVKGVNFVDVHKQYIMLIDDNIYTLKSVRKALEMNGYPTRSYLNPQRALSDYQPESFPIVITDYRMPELSGIDVLKQVRKYNSAAHVIIYTGFADENLSNEIRMHGADEFLKPLNIEELIQRIDEISRSAKEAR